MTAESPSASPEEARIEQLDNILNRLGDQAEVLYNSANPKEKATMVALDEGFTGTQDGASFDNLQAIKEDETKGGSEREFARTMLHAKVVMGMIERAETRHSPHLKTEIIAGWNQFSAHYDFEAMFSDLVNDGDEREPVNVMSLASTAASLKKGEDIAYSRLVLESRGLKQGLKQYGTRTVTAGEAEKIDNTDLETPPLIQTAEKLETVRSRAKELARRYSKTRSANDLLGWPDHHTVRSLQWLLKDHDGVDVPVIERAAANLAEKLILRPETIFTPQPDLKKSLAPEKIPLKGLDSENAEDLIVHSENLQRWLRQKIPQPFLRGINGIEVLEAGSLDGEGSEDDWSTVGTYSMYTGKIKLAHNNNVGEDLKEILTPERLANLRTIAENNGTTSEPLGVLGHEIAHNVHNNVLNMTELAEWDDIVSHNPIAVTDYVATHKMGEDARFREDFADSFKLFLKDPKELLAKSEDRFRYMGRLFAKYSPSGVQKTREQMAASWFGHAVEALDSAGKLNLE